MGERNGSPWVPPPINILQLPLIAHAVGEDGHMPIPETGGGGGAPSYTELSNGWGLRVSATQTKDNDDYEIELGVIPTISVNMSHFSHFSMILEQNFYPM